MKIRTFIMTLLAAALMPFAASTALAGSGCGGCKGGGSKEGSGDAKETSVFEVNCTKSGGGGCGGDKGGDGKA